MLTNFWYTAVFLAIGFGFCYWLIRYGLRYKRRLRWLSMPFPNEWQGILEKNLAIYRLLPDPLREQLHGHINVFLQEKRFEGCGGLQLTDEIRVIIAAQACLLLLNRRTKYYPRLLSIVVYPGDYVVKDVERDGLIENEVNSGESWQYGTIVLSWDAIRRHISDTRHHRNNVVLHEFAHQLDQEDGLSDGIPLLEQGSHYSTWAQVLSREYMQLCKDASKGKKTVLDPYGAENPAEFFAVITEAFFEKPGQLQTSHPELYEELKYFYKVDPAAWHRQVGG